MKSTIIIGGGIVGLLGEIDKLKCPTLQKGFPGKKYERKLLDFS
jgi:hypothetical protein